MSDYSKLKELAEAATAGVWVATGLDQGCAQVVQQDKPWQTVAAVTEVYPECVIHLSPEDASYIAAANPAVVMDLIAELDGYKQGAKVEADAADEARAEVRRLKAECEGLRKTLTDVRDAVQREYWDEYAGLDDTRAILDSALGEESRQ